MKKRLRKVRPQLSLATTLMVTLPAWALGTVTNSTLLSFCSCAVMPWGELVEPPPGFSAAPLSLPVMMLPLPLATTLAVRLPPPLASRSLSTQVTSVAGDATNSAQTWTSDPDRMLVQPWVWTEKWLLSKPCSQVGGDGWVGGWT